MIVTYSFIFRSNNHTNSNQNLWLLLTYIYRYRKPPRMVINKANSRISENGYWILAHKWLVKASKRFPIACAVGIVRIQPLSPPITVLVTLANRQCCLVARLETLAIFVLLVTRLANALWPILQHLAISVFHAVHVIARREYWQAFYP